MTEIHIATIQVAVSTDDPNQASDWISEAMREAGFSGHPVKDGESYTVGDWQYAIVGGQRLLPTKKYLTEDIKDYEEGDAFNA